VPTGIDFRILGPLEVLDEDRPVALGGSKQRALLALLLLHANETLSTDRLIDELWAERPPAAAAKTVQMQISRLRKALAGEAGSCSAGEVVTRERGYELVLDPERLDSHRFERLVAEGRSELAGGHPERAVAALEGALSLWRGVPLAELAAEPFAQREIARLDDLRAAALEQLIEAKLALGGHAEVVGQLEAMIGEHPYRERLRAQLMLALYRSDRQADALQAYQDARRTLVEELGIEPGERLRELERAILAQDPGLRLAAEEPAAAEPAVELARSAFVGRERELAELVGGLDDAFAGRGRLFLLGGEPGIGKSRLAEELIAHAKARGARVLVGRCWEAGGAPAYWPWVQSLRSYLRGTKPVAVRGQLGRGASEIAQMLPEVRELIPDLPAPPSAESEGARFRLFDATGTFLRNATQAEPLVLVLDDLHASDTPSLLLLRFLAGELADARILIIGVYRDVELRPDHPLASTLAELSRQRTTRRLRLGGLTEVNVARFIELTAHLEPPKALAAALHDQTDGNPLFIDEAVRLLAVEGRLAEAGGSRAWAPVIPQSARDVIGRRFGRLPEECTELLTLAAVLGREFSVRALGRVSELGGDRVLDVLDDALAENLLSQVPGALGRLRFSHGLVRDVLYDQLSPGRRARMHRRIGETLEIIYAEDPEPHLAELCHHFFEAAPGGDTAKALDYARRAGERAGALLAYEEAVRLYRMAVDILESEEPVDDALRCDLVLATGDAQMRAGDGPGARETFSLAADIAGQGRMPERLGRAALGYGGMFVWSRAAGDERVVSLLEQALATLDDGDSAIRVRLLARLSGALRDAPTRERATSLSRQAVDMARRLGDPAPLAYALDARHVVIWGPDSSDERAAITNEITRLAEETHDEERAFQGRFWRLESLLELGDVPAAKAELDAAARVADHLRQPAQLWYVAVTRALLALFEGRFDEAEDLVVQALARGQQAQSWEALVYYRMQMFALRSAQGRLAELEETIRRSVDEYPAYWVFRCVLASVYCELGREAACRKVFERLATGEFAELPRDEEWLFGMALLAPVCEFLADPPRAEVLYALLRPYADRSALSVPDLSTGSVSRSLGVLAATIGREEQAATHFQAALEMNERMGARPWLARTQHAYAVMLATRAGRGGRQRARELFGLSIENYQQIGMEAWAERAAADERTLLVARGLDAG
jgi:DNA-binding SARP family transcriptional activator